jgi:hypothetical protein
LLGANQVEPSKTSGLLQSVWLRTSLASTYGKTWSIGSGLTLYATRITSSLVKLGFPTSSCNLKYSHLVHPTSFHWSGCTR